MSHTRSSGSGSSRCTIFVCHCSILTHASEPSGRGRLPRSIAWSALSWSEPDLKTIRNITGTVIVVLVLDLVPVLDVNSHPFFLSFFLFFLFLFFRLLL